MMFNIKDVALAIKRSEISAVVSRVPGVTDPDSTRIEWFIDIFAEHRRVGEIEWAPRAYIEGLSIKVASWTALENRSLEISDALEGQPLKRGAGYLYVLEHTPTRKNSIKLGGRHGATFEFEWTATCDLFFDDDYDQDLSMAIKAPIRFIGVEVRDEVDVVRATEFVAAHLDVTELLPPRTLFKMGGGEQMPVTCWFHPKGI